MTSIDTLSDTSDRTTAVHPANDFSAGPCFYRKKFLAAICVLLLILLLGLTGCKKSRSTFTEYVGKEVALELVDWVSSPSSPNTGTILKVNFDSFIVRWRNGETAEIKMDQVKSIVLIDSRGKIDPREIFDRQNPQQK